MISPTLSIIVSVYNVENYQRRCLDSIIDQSFQDWEILLMDDGSTDSCPSICDEYAEKEPRIRLIHKANSGLSDSRNIAFGTARGKFIGYVDSDDYVEPFMFERLVDTAVRTGADITICGFEKDYADNSKETFEYPEEKIYTRDEALMLLLQDKVIKSMVWNKIYRKEIMKDPMPVGRLYEDYFTMHKWFALAETVAVCPIIGYHYVQRSQSIDHSMPLHKCLAFFEVERARYDYVIGHKLLPSADKMLKNKFAETAIREAKHIARSDAKVSDGLRATKMIADITARYFPFDPSSLNKRNYRRLLLLTRNPLLYYWKLKIEGLFKFKRKRKLY